MTDGENRASERGVGVAAGALIDRLDRRLLTVAVEVCRGLVLGMLALTVATGLIEVWVVLLAMFAGPPLGAFLFAAGSAVPFGANAALFLLAAVLLSRMRLPTVLRQRSGRSMRHEVAEGLHWLWGHTPVRVLYAHERRGQRFTMAQLMRIGLVVETLGSVGGMALGSLIGGLIVRRVGRPHRDDVEVVRPDRARRGGGARGGHRGAGRPETRVTGPAGVGWMARWHPSGSSAAAVSPTTSRTPTPR